MANDFCEKRWYLIFYVILFITGVPASESWCRGSNAPSVRKLVVDEERMMLGYWLGIASVSGLTLMVG